MLSRAAPSLRDDREFVSVLPLLGDRVRAEGTKTDVLDDVTRVFINELSSRLHSIASHPALACVSQCSVLRCQSFFWEQDVSYGSEQSTTKPVFFSPTRKSLVIDLPKLRALVATCYVDPTRPEGFDPSALADYVNNRFEFALHEYGHLASFHGAIRPTAEMSKELKEQRRALVSSLAQIPAHLRRDDAIAIVPEILSDLRAEVLRYSLSFPSDLPRDPDSFLRAGIEERVDRDAPLRSPGCNLYGLLRMSVWYGACMKAGDSGGADHVLKEIVRTCNDARIESLVEPVTQAAKFFARYVIAHRFDAAVFRASVLREGVSGASDDRISES